MTFRIFFSSITNSYTLLQSSAVKAGLDEAPSVQNAAVWLYGEALPNGWLDAEQAGLVGRALAFTQSGDVPPVMLEALLVDVERFVQG